MFGVRRGRSEAHGLKLSLEAGDGIMLIHLNAAALIFLAVGGVVLGYVAHKRGLNPWMWGGISVAVLFLTLMLPLNGLLSLILGAGVMVVAIYTAANAT